MATRRYTRILGLLVGLAIEGGAILPAAGQSGSVVVFQATYDRSGSATNLYQNPVSTCDPTQSYRLVLENGVDGRAPVSKGSVSLNGTKMFDVTKRATRLERQVALRAANDLVVSLGGKQVGRIRITLDGAPRCLGVRLDSPVPFASLSEPETLVAGEVDVPGPVGVSLRVAYAPPDSAPVEVAWPVQVNDSRFAAFVPLESGTFTLTASASDALGRTGEAAVTVTVTPDPPENDRGLPPDVTPTSGFAPLTVTFGCGAAGDPEIDLADLDVDGDGQPDFTLVECGVSPHRVSHTYTTAGLDITTLSLRDVSGRTYTRRVPVNVIPMPDLGTAWDAFRAALGRGDVDGALWFIALEARERHRRVFEDLKAELPVIAAALGSLAEPDVRSTYATAWATRLSNGESLAFPVSLVFDADGVWRIASF